MAFLVDEFGWDPVEERAFLQSIADGRTHLVLGAGGSVGALGGDGEPIPLARPFARALCDVFSLDVIDTDRDRENLALVYGEAVASDARSKSGETVHTYLKRKFTMCTASWQVSMCAVPWARTWSFNIDDVYEDAWKKQRGAALLSSIGWRDAFRPVDSQRDEHQIIHLHGRAEQLLTPDAALVFSLYEYAKVDKAAFPWHAEFRSVFTQQPVVVCGARLVEEFDLMDVVNPGNQSSVSQGVPSVMVLPSVSELDRRRIERAGLRIVLSDGEKFFAALATAVNQMLVASAAVTEANIRFASQFRELRVDFQAKSTTDFFAGHEPRWEHILQDDDGRLSATSKAIDHLISKVGGATEVSQRLCLLHGSAGTGKSTVALRIAREALSQGYRAFAFRNEEGIDVVAANQYCANYPATLLVFDACADFSESIGDLFRKAKIQNINIRALLAERTSRTRSLRQDVSAASWRDVALDRLTRDDRFSVIASRRRFTRLGTHSRLSDEDLEQQFRVDSDGHMIDFLARLEGAQGYRDKVLSEISDLALPNNWRIAVRATCAVHSHGYSAPLHALSRLSGIAVSEIASSASKQHSHIFAMDGLGLRMRHRMFAEVMWRNSFSLAERLATTVQLLSFLAPQINPESIRRKVPAHRIARALMRQEAAHDSLQADGALEMYRQLEVEYAWHSRFWEQRALLMSRLGEHEPAYSYASEAVRLERHPFTLNTFGTVCSRAAIALLGKDEDTALHRFLEGEDSLHQSRRLAELRGEDWEHPYRTFFANALKWQRACRGRPHLILDVDTKFHRWMDEARESSAFMHDREQASLNRIEAAWIAAMARDSNS
jgi:hypothetical protein